MLFRSPAVGFSIGFERIVDLVEAGEDVSAAAIVLVHDADIPVADLLALKASLVRTGARVRLERRAKNLRPILERASADGYTAFANVGAGATADSLELKPLA